MYDNLGRNPAGPAVVSPKQPIPKVRVRNGGYSNQWAALQALTKESRSDRALKDPAAGSDMTNSIFSLRQLGLQDGQAYAAVLAASPDTGSIGTAVRFEIDPYKALMSLHGDTVGVVAETPEYNGFVGSGLIRFGECQWEGEVRPSALLNTLVVHPDYRRRGVASQLARWREEAAHKRFGESGVIWAIIQRNNTGSERTAQKWASQFLGSRLAVIPLRMRSSPPRRSEHLIVRAAQPNELGIVAEQLNRYYRDYNLYHPETQASLSTWLNETPFSTPFRHYWIVTNQTGQLLGGMALAENCRLRITLITSMPAPLRLLNKLFRVIPINGELKEIALSRIWYAHDQLNSARHLMETLRWEWREKGTSLVLCGDVRSDLMRLPSALDRMAKEITSIAVRGPGRCLEDRLYYYA